jgi:carboxypeptidase T
MSLFTIICFLTIIVLLIPLASSGHTPNNHEMIRTAREQHLKEIKDQTPFVTPAGLYRTYEEMTVLLQSLATNHSEIMSLTSIGKTYEGRDLWLVKLSDNVSQDEDEPGVLLMGAHHGNEKPSYEVCLYFIQHMVEQYENSSLPEIRAALDSTQIYVIPMVNPDGVEAGTRKNRVPNHGLFGFRKEVTSLGVDLNRNYGYRWFRYFLLFPFYMSSTSLYDGSNVYRGQLPFSENETQAIREFMQNHSITIALSYHTYGNLILYPWGYTVVPPKDKPVFISISENISAINQYIFGQSIDLYPTIGDTCDWMYGTYGVYAFTIELGDSYAPLDPDVILEMCVLHTQVNLYVCQRAQSL